MTTPGNPDPLTIDLGYLTLKGLAWGPRDAPPVLALHGWLDNAASFAPLADHIGKYRFLALDLPGHGHSEHRPRGVQYHFVDWVTDVIRVVDKLELDDFILLGHSLGGAVAVSAAAVLGDRINALALIESTGAYVKPATEACETLTNAISQMKRMEERTEPTYKELERLIKARVLASPMTEVDAALIINRSVEKLKDGYRWRSDPRLKISSPMYLTEDHVRAYIAALKVETLLIRGTESGFTDRRFLTDRQPLFRALEVVDLPGRHHLHMESADAVADVLNRFFQRCA